VTTVVTVTVTLLRRPVLLLLLGREIWLPMNTGSPGRVEVEQRLVAAHEARTSLNSMTCVHHTTLYKQLLTTLVLLGHVADH
jgi:hypothetical protein